MKYFGTTLFGFMTTIMLTRADKDHPKCLSIVMLDYDSCTSLRPSFHSILSDGQCTNNPVCKKPFSLTSIRIEPFTDILKMILTSAMDICCGPCRNKWQYSKRDISINKLNHTLINSSNIIFPVVGLHSATRIYGYHYIPVIDLSGGYYITRAHTEKEVMRKLIKACANLWPLLVIILLLSIIAGFLIWIMDTWINKDQFPRSFFFGLFNGFWWSFISMTTVGYGDKIPKFIISRLFSVIWILIGMIICSLFTASLTNEITAASKPANPDMRGKNIGILKYRTFDASVVAKNCGRIRETKGISEADDIVELQHMLADSNSDVSGLFMDKYTFAHSTVQSKAIQVDNSHDNSPSMIIAAKYFLEKTIATKKAVDGERMSYGLLIREEEDFNFLYDFIKDNHAIYETCATLMLNAVVGKIDDDMDGHDLFLPKGGHFYPTLTATGSACGAILFFGILFEIYRWKWGKLDDVTSTQ